MAYVGLLLGFHKAAVKVLARLHSYLELRVLFQIHSDFWQNSVPCGSKTEAISPSRLPLFIHNAQHTNLFLQGQQESVPFKKGLLLLRVSPD